MTINKKETYKAYCHIASLLAMLLYFFAIVLYLNYQDKTKYPELFKLSQLGQASGTVKNIYLKGKNADLVYILLETDNGHQLSLISTYHKNIITEAVQIDDYVFVIYASSSDIFKDLWGIQKDRDWILGYQDVLSKKEEKIDIANYYLEKGYGFPWLLFFAVMSSICGGYLWLLYRREG